MPNKITVQLPARVGAANPASRARMGVRPVKTAVAPGLSQLERDAAMREIIVPHRVVARAAAMSWLQAAPTLAEVLRLLPPKLAAKIRNSQNKALHEFLLAWGRSLRKQAVLAKAAQKRAQLKAQVAKGQAQAHETLRLANLRLLTARAQAAQDAMTPSAAPSGTTRFVKNWNEPMGEALALPILSGFSLRARTPKLIQF